MSPAPQLTYEAHHFLGMRLVSDVADWDHKYVYRALNLFPHNGIYWPRPGDALWVVEAFAERIVQGEALLRKADGTTLDVIVAGGELYKRPTAGTAFTKEITTANLTAAGIVLNSTARVWMATFNDQLVVTDGVNTPFVWTGASGAGLTELTNAPVAYGPPAVYYGKLFLVKNTERVTIVWSEENQPNTGYEAGGFNNAWRLGQTAQVAQLECLMGLNDGLYYFRRTSIGVIRGAVTPDFATAGVHDAVSGEVGSSAPGSVLYYGNHLWFTDAFGRPWRLAPGAGPEPLWAQMDAFFAGSDLPGTGASGRMVASDIALTLCAAYPQVGAVVVAYTPYSDAFYSRLFAFRATDGQLLGELDFGANVSIDYVGNGLAEGLEEILTLSVSNRVSGQTQNHTSPVSQQGANFYSGLGTYALTLGPWAADGRVLPFWEMLELFIEHVVDSNNITLSVRRNDGANLNAASVVVLNAVAYAASASAHRRRRIAIGLGLEQRFLMVQVLLHSGFAGIAGVRGLARAQPLAALTT